MTTEKKNPVDALRAIQAELAKLDDLHDLRKVNGLIRARWSEIQRGALAEKVTEGGLVAGAEVIVDLGPRHGGKVAGTVRKVNARTVSVDTPRGAFKVSAAIITLKTQQPAA